MMEDENPLKAVEAVAPARNRGSVRTTCIYIFCYFPVIFR